MENRPFIKSSEVRYWYVIYTKPRWEKKVDKLLKMNGIESYCPVRIVESQWADRKKKVELPLFSSYVFVKINLKEEQTVRQTLGVLNFIYYMQKPAVVKDSVIEEMRYFLSFYPQAEIVGMNTISAGDRVVIKKGIFHNCQGSVINVQGKSVLMVFDNLQCALVTRVPIYNLDLV